MKKRLAIILTHPIQYYAPLFKLLAQRNNIVLKVFYTWGEEGIKPKYDPGFGKTIEWDIPLLEGYEYEFLKNTSSKPGSSHFQGIRNPEAVKRIQAFLPDVLLIYGWAYYSHLNLMRQFNGKIPVWFRGDSNLIDQQKGWKQVLRTLLLSWVYGHVDKAFYVGSANKEYFRKYGLEENQLVFAPHAIDNARFAGDYSKQASKLRAELGIRAEDVLILFAGKLETKKDPELLLNAFSQLKKDTKHLLFVGNGLLEENLKAKVESEKLHNVYFMDFQNQQQMPAIYQACDLFCLPSKGPGETWGLAVNEAMAAGKAVLVSEKAGSAGDLVETDINGYLLKSGNLIQLHNILESLNKTDLETMGKNSLKSIRNWTFESQAIALEKALT